VGDGCFKIKMKSGANGTKIELFDRDLGGTDDWLFYSQFGELFCGKIPLIRCWSIVVEV